MFFHVTEKSTSVLESRQDPKCDGMSHNPLSLNSWFCVLPTGSPFAQMSLCLSCDQMSAGKLRVTSTPELKNLNLSHLLEVKSRVNSDCIYLAPFYSLAKEK